MKILRDMFRKKSYKKRKSLLSEAKKMSASIEGLSGEIKIGEEINRKYLLLPMWTKKLDKKGDASDLIGNYPDLLDAFGFNLKEYWTINLSFGDNEQGEFRVVCVREIFKEMERKIDSPIKLRAYSLFVAKLENMHLNINEKSIKYVEYIFHQIPFTIDKIESKWLRLFLENKISSDSSLPLQEFAQNSFKISRLILFQMQLIKRIKTEDDFISFQEDLSNQEHDDLTGRLVELKNLLICSEENIKESDSREDNLNCKRKNWVRMKLFSLLRPIKRMAL